MIEGKKISKLDPIQNLQEACCFPVLSRGATRKITFAALLNNIIAKLPDASQEEIDEIKRTISRLEKQIEAVAIDNKEVEELLKDVTFTIDGQNATILEYTAKIREFEQEIGSSSIAESIQRINSFIPSTASETNKLVSKSYVDESIQTSTAVNRGSFETYADLVAYSGTVTRNDYAYVADDETHDHEAWRYKWNDNTHEWTAEYRINEAPMTLEQLAALNSGITEDKVVKLDSVEEGAQKNTVNSVNGLTGDVEIPGLTVDDELSTTSEMPVQNKIITHALNNMPDITKVVTEATRSFFNTQGSNYYNTEDQTNYFIVDPTNTIGTNLYLVSKGTIPATTGTAYFVTNYACSLSSGTIKIYINGVDTGKTITLSAAKSLTARYVYYFTFGGTSITPSSPLAPVYKFTVDLQGFTLTTGSRIKITFKNACIAYDNNNNSYTPTLNVNNTGAKTININKHGLVTPITPKKFYGVAYYWQPYTTLELMYTGSEWLIVNDTTLFSYSTDKVSCSVKTDGLIEQYGETNVSTNYTATVKFAIKTQNRLKMIFTPNDNTDHSDSRYGYYNDTEDGFYAKSYGSKVNGIV